MDTPLLDYSSVLIAIIYYLVKPIRIDTELLLFKYMSPMAVVIYFFIYSFLGWIVDTASRSYYAQDFVTGSFFPAPFCPIYGFGALIVLFMYRSLKTYSLFTQWLVYTVTLGFLEYTSGHFLYALFAKRWWHYPDGFMNFDGYTDVPHAMAWGVLAILLVTHLHPAISSFLFAQQPILQKLQKRKSPPTRDGRRAAQSARKSMLSRTTR